MPASAEKVPSKIVRIAAMPAINRWEESSWQEREQTDSVFGEKPLHQTKRNKQSNQQNSRHIRYLFSLKYYLIKEWQKTDQCNRFFAF